MRLSSMLCKTARFPWPRQFKRKGQEKPRGFAYLPIRHFVPDMYSEEIILVGGNYTGSVELEANVEIGRK